jgi:hypothetical protein
MERESERGRWEVSVVIEAQKELQFESVSLCWIELCTILPTVCKKLLMRIGAFFVSLSKLFYYHNFFELWIFEHYDLQE